MTLPATQKELFTGVQMKSFYPDLEEFTAKLNELPEQKWLQKTPDGKAEYIPVGIIEMNLRKDFAGLVKFCVISERRELNEYIVVARISVFHPIVMQWLDYDGIGASQITQNRVELKDLDGKPRYDQSNRIMTRSADLAEFNDTKQKNALELNAPKAYAEAIKNAAKKIGKKYGADINRKHEDVYEDVYTQEAEFKSVSAEVLARIDKCNTRDELTLLWDTYPEMHHNQNFIKLFKLRGTQISMQQSKNQGAKV